MTTTRPARRPASARDLLCGRGEQGSALVEYVVIVAFVLVPMVYLVMLLAEIQSAAFASTAAAREAGRVAAAEVAAGHPGATGAGQAAAELTGSDFGHTRTTARLECVGCDRPTADGAVTATAEVEVTLPGLDRIGITGPSVLTLSSTHVEPLDALRAGEAP